MLSVEGELHETGLLFCPFEYQQQDQLQSVLGWETTVAVQRLAMTNHLRLFLALKPQGCHKLIPT